MMFEILDVKSYVATTLSDKSLSVDALTWSKSSD